MESAPNYNYRGCPRRQDQVNLGTPTPKEAVSRGSALQSLIEYFAELSSKAADDEADLLFGNVRESFMIRYPPLDQSCNQMALKTAIRMRGNRTTSLSTTSGQRIIDPTHDRRTIATERFQRLR
jgi:hypothetical protein